ncbi:MAG TPA: patatin-like phospholipase family protein [Bacteroidota bacterium]|nr:patatin-like phospholipase family protein [Bacteroidota bacterium]
MNRRKKLVKIFRFVLILLLCIASQSISQNRPKLGLVLSGGGAKGLAHIGVLKVLEEAGIRPDYITGTSMGSVVGGLYAMGYTVAQIESVMHTLDWNSLLSDRTDYRLLAMEQKRQVDRYVGLFPIADGRVHLPGGMNAGQRIGILLSRLTAPFHSLKSFSELPIPFACVSTDIATGRPVLIDKGDIGDAIRASMSIPTVFTPMLIDSLLFVDGGLVRNFPVEEVRRMGADIVIGVDVGAPSLKKEEIRDFIQVLVQATQFSDALALAHERALCDVLILPDIKGLSLLEFENADAIIRRGEIAARIIRPKIDSVAALTNRLSPRLPAVDLGEYRWVDEIRINGLTHLSRQTILADFGLDAPLVTTITEIEHGIERIYSSQEYDRVSYRICKEDEKTVLQLSIIERDKKYFRAGIRYDSYQQASLLLNTTLWNIGKDPGMFTADLKLGRHLRADVQYAFPLGVRPGLGVRAQIVFDKFPFQMTTQGVTYATFMIRTYSASVAAGSLYNRMVSAAVGLRSEYTELASEVYMTDFTWIERRLVGFADLWVTTFDRPTYPHSGISLRGVVDASPAIGTSQNFARMFINCESAIPLQRSTVLFANGFFGLGSKTNMPIPYSFILGGVRMPAAYPYMKPSQTTFMGVKDQELYGDQAQMLSLGVRYEAFKDGFLQMQMNTGNAFAGTDVSIKGRRYVTGGGVTFGYLSPIGPLEFSVMRGNLGTYVTYVNIGFDF